MTKEIEKAYQAMLDEAVPVPNGLPYSVLLQRGDPTTYNLGLSNFASRYKEEEDDDGCTNKNN